MKEESTSKAEAEAKRHHVFTGARLRASRRRLDRFPIPNPQDMGHLKTHEMQTANERKSLMHMIDEGATNLPNKTLFKDIFVFSPNTLLCVFIKILTTLFLLIK